jgi:hypothetical protein
MLHACTSTGTGVTDGSIGRIDGGAVTAQQVPAASAGSAEAAAAAHGRDLRTVASNLRRLAACKRCATATAPPSPCASASHACTLAFRDREPYPTPFYFQLPSARRPAPKHERGSRRSSPSKRRKQMEHDRAAAAYVRACCACFWPLIWG